MTPRQPESADANRWQEADSPVWATLAAVLALAVTTAYGALNSREFWLDETHSALLSQMPLAEMMRWVRGDVHPPLYFILLNGWENLFGSSPIALRSLSGVFHLLAVAAAYSLARALGLARQRAALAILFCAVTPALLMYSAEARMYSLLVALITGATAISVSLMKTTAGLRHAVLLGVALAAAFYTHYVALFVAAGLLLAVGASAVARRCCRRRVAVAGLTFVVLSLPWVPTVLEQRATKLDLTVVESIARSDSASFLYGTEPPSDPALVKRVRVWTEDAASLAGVAPVFGFAGLIATALPIAAALMLMGMAPQSISSPIFVRAVALVASTIVASATLGIAGRRYFLFLAPIFALLTVFGVVEAHRRYGRSVGNIIWIALLAVHVVGATRLLLAHQPREWHEVAAMLANGFEDGDIILVESPHGQVPLEYHAQRAGLQAQTHGFPSDIADWWDSQPFKGWGGAVATTADLLVLRNMLDDMDEDATVWLVQFEADHRDPEGRLLRFIADADGYAVSLCSERTVPTPDPALYAVQKLTARTRSCPSAQRAP